ncbi:MAG: hypothetical protein NVSMB52_17420 [Chloroflexota bacterium]
MDETEQSGYVKRGLRPYVHAVKICEMGAIRIPLRSARTTPTLEKGQQDIVCEADAAVLAKVREALELHRIWHRERERTRISEMIGHGWRENHADHYHDNDEYASEDTSQSKVPH